MFKALSFPKYSSFEGGSLAYHDGPASGAGGDTCPHLTHIKYQDETHDLGSGSAVVVIDWTLS
jgi:hypothetical protein